ncbi:lasso RiPP family leader peptide-containing protein [Streptomyces specialis]|nr:lasso RiPP family leader peptide-containing protein [Streptomyces specialis]
MAYVPPQVTVLGSVHDVTLGTIAEDSQDEDRYFFNTGEGTEEFGEGQH